MQIHTLNLIGVDGEKVEEENDSGNNSNNED